MDAAGSGKREHWPLAIVLAEPLYDFGSKLRHIQANRQIPLGTSAGRYRMSIAISPDDGRLKAVTICASRGWALEVGAFGFSNDAIAFEHRGFLFQANQRTPGSPSKVEG